MFSKDFIYTLCVVLFIMIIFNRRIEKFSNKKKSKKSKESKELSESSIPSHLKKDIESIKNLSEISKLILEKDKLTLPTHLRITGKFNLLKKGTITPFYGSVIPEGWALCNGATVKDLDGNDFRTPNLQGRFILGGNTYDTDEDKLIGGSSTYKLTIDNLPAHNHTGTTNKDGEHNHKIKKYGQKKTSTKGIFKKGSKSFTGDLSKDYGDLTIENDEKSMHQHKFTTDNTGYDENDITPIDIMPPFYKLKYIIKL